jgi:hypothetical protein
MEKIIRRTSGANLTRLPFSALHSFHRKLQRALKRRRSASERLVMWNITRDEVDSAFDYLILFTRPDVPAEFLSNAEGEAIVDFLVDLV